MAFNEFACDLGNFPRKVTPLMGFEKTNENFIESLY